MFGPTLLRINAYYQLNLVGTADDNRLVRLVRLMTSGRLVLLHKRREPRKSQSVAKQLSGPVITSETNLDRVRSSRCCERKTDYRYDTLGQIVGFNSRRRKRWMRSFTSLKITGRWMHTTSVSSFLFLTHLSATFYL